MRLFVSVRPSSDAVAHLLAHLRGVRTSRPEQWHITLAFLGEVPSAEPLQLPLRTATAGHRAFELRLSGAGTFGSRTTWVGVVGDVTLLRSLADDVQQACVAAGVRLEDRAYRPHLTVGRVDPHVLSGYEGPSWQVEEVELVHSVLGRQAVHTVLETYALGYQA